MKHLVLNLIGLVAGLVAGFLLVPQPLLARFASAHVIWDGNQCAAGVYTITSTANNIVTGESFQTTLQNVRLPQATIGQDFSDLPGGTYRVVAQAVNPDGDSYQSDQQTITIAGSSAPPSTYGTQAGSSAGRRRPSTLPASGSAQPRSSSVSGSNQGGGPRSSGGGSVAGSTSATGSEDVRTAATSLAVRAQVEVSLAWALETLSQLTRVGHGGAPAVRDVAFVDEDEDGSIDYVRAVIGGRLVVWRISR